MSSLKWVPKYAIVNKLDKSALLYDYEPTNEIIDTHYSTFVFNNTTNNTNVNVNEVVNSNETELKQIQTEMAASYRLDASVKREQFLNFWRNHTTKFDVDKNCEDNYFSFYNYTNFNSLNSQQTSDSYAHHHLSNKDIG